MPYAALMLIATAFVTEGSYPRPELLIAPEQLARPDFTQGLVVLDTRGPQEYEQGHVPSARRVDPANWAKAFGDGGDAEGWSQRIGELGIAADSTVVVYDDSKSKDAARVWWILRYWGVADARLLNGGWSGWAASQLPIETDTPAPAAASEFVARPVSERFADKALVLGSLADHSLQIVDARSEREFCGDETLSNKRAGAIPGARRLEWSELIDAESLRFKNPEELRALFDEAGIDIDKPVATHCQSGGRASVLAFGLELMGGKEVRNYYRGWSEWGNDDDTPVVVDKQE